MKSLTRKFSVCTLGSQGGVVLTPRDLHMYSFDYNFREFLEQSAIKLDQRVKYTKTSAINSISNKRHIFLFSNKKHGLKTVFNFIKSHSNTLFSIGTVLTFLSLMIA